LRDNHDPNHAITPCHILKFQKRLPTTPCPLMYRSPVCWL
jgi:hypothetical protein